MMSKGALEQGRGVEWDGDDNVEDVWVKEPKVCGGTEVKAAVRRKEDTWK